MTLRANSKARRAVLALIATTMTLVAGVTGCLGAGNEIFPPVPASDGSSEGAADSGSDSHPDSAGDAPNDAAADHVGDGAMPDATVQDSGMSDAADATVKPPTDAGHATVVLPSSIDFGDVGCGTKATLTPVIKNIGINGLSMSVTVTSDSGFNLTMDPSTLSIQPGDGGAKKLTLTASVPSAGPAGTVFKGALNKFT